MKIRNYKSGKKARKNLVPIRIHGKSCEKEFRRERPAPKWLRKIAVFLLVDEVPVSGELLKNSTVVFAIERVV